MSSQINPEDSFEEEQLDQDEDTEPSEKPTVDDSGDEETFTDVTLDDINRDDLDPAMQAAYDTIQERYSGMQTSYTQSMQLAAASRDDAERWRQVEGNPRLAQAINDVVYRINNGIPDKELDQEKPAELPSQEEDPEGYLKGLMAQVFREEFGKVMPGLQQEIGTVSKFVKGQQTDLEFQNLVAKYPAAKNFGLVKLNGIRNQYVRSDGGVMPLEKVFHLAAMDDPTLLTNPENPPGGRKSIKKTIIERPGKLKTDRDVLDLPEGIKGLHKQALANQGKEHKSLKELARAGMDKLRGKGEIVE
jgi:hypothetical protein